MSVLEKENMRENTDSSLAKSMIGRSDFLIFHDHSYKKFSKYMSTHLELKGQTTHKKNEISCNTEILISTCNAKHSQSNML